MITVRGLSKVYGRVRAVDHLGFDVPAGRVTGFLGPNGAGKSTTMRMVVGLDRPTAGTALVDGRSYRDLTAPLHHVGALLDAGAVHPGRTGRAHLRVAARTHGIARQRVEEVIGLVGLEGAAGRRTKGYSLGMRQRLGIAAALLGDPGVLLFDEPVNGLDVDGVRWIRALRRPGAAAARDRPDAVGRRRRPRHAGDGRAGPALPARVRDRRGGRGRRRVVPRPGLLGGRGPRARRGAAAALRRRLRRRAAPHRGMRRSGPVRTAGISRRDAGCPMGHCPGARRSD